jgi:hypothetical protein
MEQNIPESSPVFSGGVGGEFDIASLIPRADSQKRKRIETKPKKSLTSFMLFSLEKRPHLKSEHPEWKVSDFGKKLGELWRELTDDERRVFSKKLITISEIRRSCQKRTRKISTTIKIL